jgi:hypothetical protein
MRNEEGGRVLMLVAGLGLLGGAAYLLTRKALAAAPPTVTSPPRPLGLPLPRRVQASPVLLDSGLSQEETHAVLYALSREPSPGNLVAFAETLDPDHPVAAARLRARAVSLGTAVSGEPCCDACKSGDSPCAGSA